MLNTDFFLKCFWILFIWNMNLNLLKGIELFFFYCSTRISPPSEGHLIPSLLRCGLEIYSWFTILQKMHLRHQLHSIIWFLHIYFHIIKPLEFILLCRCKVTRDDDIKKVVLVWRCVAFIWTTFIPKIRSSFWGIESPWRNS